jgi:hypothetical protein
MTLSELLPTIDLLSHQDKLRLIHFLLLAVAKEEGCSLEPIEEIDRSNVLLNRLSATEAVVWSPQADNASVRALSDLLVAAKDATND